MAPGARGEIEPRRFHPALVFALLFVGVFALHLPLLRLPYFWDEAGYYVPAARDLLLTGTLIPHSTLSNAHPPLVMAYLALWWKIAGYAPEVTRTAMLLIAAFSLLGVFRLAQRIARTEVAIAATVCTALYPVFFAQSSLAHLDLAAAGLTFWGLSAYVEERRAATALWFSLAALAKETAILAPAALFAWEALCPLLRREEQAESPCLFPESSRTSALLLIPLIQLGLWYAYHYLRTGFTFGNPEFFRYNVEATLHPVRVWRGVVAIVALAFVAGWFVNPPYGFSPEDNLAYRDYILLHQHAENFVEARYPMAWVLTAWPASDELTRPYLGYVTRPMRVFRIEDFTAEQLMSAADFRSRFDVALVFSTKYEPPHPLLERWRRWQEWNTRFFGYHRDVPPAAAAQILGGQLVYTETRNGQWVGVIEMEQVIEARR